MQLAEADTAITLAAAGGGMAALGESGPVKPIRRASGRAHDTAPTFVAAGGLAAHGASSTEIPTACTAEMVGTVVPRNTRDHRGVRIAGTRGEQDGMDRAAVAPAGNGKVVGTVVAKDQRGGSSAAVATAARYGLVDGPLWWNVRR